MALYLQRTMEMELSHFSLIMEPHLQLMILTGPQGDTGAAGASGSGASSVNNGDGTFHTYI